MRTRPQGCSLPSPKSILSLGPPWADWGYGGREKQGFQDSPWSLKAQSARLRLSLSFLVGQNRGSWEKRGCLGQAGQLGRIWARGAAVYSTFRPWAPCPPCQPSTTEIFTFPCKAWTTQPLCSRSIGCWLFGVHCKPELCSVLGKMLRSRPP